MDQKKENFVLNSFEIATGKTKLSSTPQYITIGAHYSCNAQCVFCLGGNFPPFSLQIYKELFEKKLVDVLRKADHIGFCGFGEIFLMPGVTEFLDHINRTLPENTKVFNTNGIPLNDEICEKLTEGKYSLLISLHASNAALHASLTGTKKFDHIAERIKRLVTLRKEKNSTLHINLIFIVVNDNISDLPEFVTFAKRIGADRVTCNYVTIFEPHQLKMSTFFNKAKTEVYFNKALEAAQREGVTLILPPRYGALKNSDTVKPVCHDPWNFFYVETQGSVNPCCYAGDHIGYLDKQSFEQIWNGPGYTALREGLITGDTHFWCKHCMKHDPANVDDIRSHITFRPETQKMIMKYIKDEKIKY